VLQLYYTTTATLITNKYFKKDAYEKNIEEELKDNYRKILKHVIENNICI
jgi:hypothetical protein